MRPILPALAALPLLALPAHAQQSCAVAGTPDAVDPCIVGFWVGESSAAEVVRNNLQQLALPGMPRTTLPAIPAALGMIVAPDGAYVTMTFSEGHSFIDQNDHDTIISSMQLTGAPQSGYLSAGGGQMTYCTTHDSLAWLDISATSTLGGSKQATIPVTPGGASFTPRMSYQCYLSYLTITVQLPPPIGPIEYRLAGVSPDSFGEYFSAAVLDRLRAPAPDAPADADPPASSDGASPDGIEPVEPVEVVIPGADGITPVTPVEVPIPAPRRL